MTLYIYDPELGKIPLLEDTDTAESVDSKQQDIDKRIDQLPEIPTD